MTVYGGFTNGSYQGWSLNLLFNNFGTNGVLRGMAVSAPGGMTVGVGVDPTWGDGIIWLKNGCFVRIDQAITFSVPSNGTGGTRTDAIVAFCDPTGGSNPNVSFSYTTNWAGGFAGATTNQFVLALVSVAPGAVNIVSGNISVNAQAAALGGGGGGGGTSSGMVASDGIGLAVQDNSSTSQLTVVTTGLTTGVGRAVVIAATDRSGNNHYFYCNTDGSFTLAGPVHAVADSAGGAFNALQVNGHNLTAGSTAPTSPVKYDIWLKTSF